MILSLLNSAYMHDLPKKNSIQIGQRALQGGVVARTRIARPARRAAPARRPPPAGSGRRAWRPTALPAPGPLRADSRPPEPLASATTSRRPRRTRGCGGAEHGVYSYMNNAALESGASRGQAGALLG